jgi:hypothetical protein
VRDFGAGWLQGRGAKCRLAPFLCPLPKPKEGHAMSKQPSHKLKIGLVTATVWKNDGFYSVEITRGYKTEGEWKSSSSLGQGDLLNAAKCAERAEIWINRQLSAAK